MRIYVTGNDFHTQHFEESLRKFGELVVEGNRRRPEEQKVELVLGTGGEMLAILAKTGAPCIVLHLGRGARNDRRPNVHAMPCESEGGRLDRILQCDAFCFYPGKGQVAAELVWIVNTILQKEAFPVSGSPSIRPRRLALANGRGALGGDWSSIVVEGLFTLTDAGPSSWSRWLENCSTPEHAYSFLTLPLPFGCFYAIDFRPLGLFFDAHFERAFSIKVFEFQPTVREGFRPPTDEHAVQPEFSVLLCFESFDGFEPSVKVGVEEFDEIRIVRTVVNRFE